MPVISHVDHEQRRVFSTIEGTVTGDDMIKSRVNIRSEPNFNPDCFQLIDCKDINELKISARGIQIISSGEMICAGARRAFVVASDAAFGFSHMFQMVREQGSEETEVRRDMQEAQRGLCLE